MVAVPSTRRPTFSTSRLVSFASSFDQHQAVVIDHGPSNFGWARASLPNGEECLLFPDSAETVPVKSLPIGQILNVQEPRPSNKGPTKWISSALASNLQPADISDYCVSSDSNGPADHKELKLKKVSLNARYSITRHRKVNQIIDKHGLSGKYAIAEAVAHAIDLCIENNLV